MSQVLTEDKSTLSTLVQVVAWCRQATNHYLSQCWPVSMHRMVSAGHSELTSEAVLPSCSSCNSWFWRCCIPGICQPECTQTWVKLLSWPWVMAWAMKNTYWFISQESYLSTGTFSIGLVTFVITKTAILVHDLWVKSLQLIVAFIFLGLTLKQVVDMIGYQDSSPSNSYQVTCPLSKQFDILYRPQLYYCHTTCQISKQLNIDVKCYEQTKAS